MKNDYKKTNKSLFNLFLKVIILLIILALISHASEYSNFIILILAAIVLSLFDTLLFSKMRDK